jgi:ADP-ribose pyrophosphatase
MTEDLSETRLSGETVFKGRLLDVRRDEVRLPNGQTSTREYIVHPGAVVILPRFANGDVLLERQHRYPLHRDFIEFPAGKLDPGESPEACAARELLEETGYRAGRLNYLATLYPCIGYSDEKLIFYLAEELVCGDAQRDADEFLEVFRLPFDDALNWLDQGRICEAKTVMGLHLLLRPPRR